MYLSRLLLNPSSRAVCRDLADCQQLHRTIMSAFPQAEGHEGAREHFGVLHRLDLDRRRNLLVLYVQSLAPPDWSRLPASYLLAETDLENPAVKPVGQAYRTLKPGTVLSFRLRANPTRKIDTKSGPDGKRRHGRRVELVQEDQQLAWLSRKGEEGGFQVLSLRVGGFSKEVGRRKAGGSPLTVAGVIFEGRLRVTDPQKFMDQSLTRGIGPGKAYGLGLLSLAPP
ncbi:MAG: type I-E CRISPR-associated protein Cas6/Cse3/CasE [Deltaproteobacteria bacterium]|nr:type I-E CRISPR-associated protein Cas6/Cse3/CasE [Deltaproteobacteria bacterium]